jgi:hypothetical protein
MTTPLFIGISPAPVSLLRQCGGHGHVFLFPRKTAGMKPVLAALVLLAGGGRGFDWDTYDQQQYACRAADQIARECAPRLRALRQPLAARGTAAMQPFRAPARP